MATQDTRCVREGDGVPGIFKFIAGITYVYERSFCSVFSVERVIMYHVDGYRQRERHDDMADNHSKGERAIKVVGIKVEAQRGDSIELTW